MKRNFLWLIVLSALLFVACLPSAPSGSQGKRTITVYGFSIMKEALEKEIYPAFAEKSKRENDGEEVGFFSSFAGSETVTNQILQGAPADFAILSIERDVERLAAGGAVTQTRPKTETLAFPLQAGQIVTAGLVRFRVLPNFTLASERASRMIDTEK